MHYTLALHFGAIDELLIIKLSIAISFLKKKKIGIAIFFESTKRYCN